MQTVALVCAKCFKVVCATAAAAADPVDNWAKSVGQSAMTNFSLVLEPRPETVPITSRIVFASCVPLLPHSVKTCVVYCSLTVYKLCPNAGAAYFEACISNLNMSQWLNKTDLKAPPNAAKTHPSFIIQQAMTARRQSLVWELGMTLLWSLCRLESSLGGRAHSVLCRTSVVCLVRRMGPLGACYCMLGVGQPQRRLQDI